MTADQTKKLAQVANALARSGVSLREIINQPHPFTEHWRNDE